MNKHYSFRVVSKDGKQISLFRFSCSETMFKLATARTKFLLHDFSGYHPCVCSWVMSLSELNISFTLKSISNDDE